MKKDERISAMAARLRQFHRADGREGVGRTLLGWIEDPLKPRTKRGKFHINPILVLLAAMAALGAGTCLVFTLVQL
jgi:hypothetical protein